MPDPTSPPNRKNTDSDSTPVEVVFTPSGRRGSVAHGTTVLEAARQLGVDLDTVCGGRGICGRCQVLATDPTGLSGPTAIETDYRGKRPLATNHRLGCAAQILGSPSATDAADEPVGEVVIDVPEASQIHRQVVRKSVNIDDLEIDPVVTLHYLELGGSELEDRAEEDPGSAPAVDDRILEALAAQWDRPGVTVAPSALSQLHHAASARDGAMTVAVRGGPHSPAGTVVGAWPGFVDRIVGVAVDLGSTTIAGHLCDLASGEVLASGGRMNPQIRFGEDLMSRVSHVMMHDGDHTDLTDAARSAIDELVDELLADANEPKSDLSDDGSVEGVGRNSSEAGLDRSRVLEITVVGNPIMHHLFLGIDPTPLGQAPFPLATDRAVDVAAPDLGLGCPNARVYLAPCIAGHVGADTAAAILNEGPHRTDRVQLLVDVGTNAEIVLGNRHQLFAASSPTGPAFEGAQISAGQRATAGAIERVQIDRETLEPRYRVIGCELWSDEDGFDAAAAKLGINGICGSGIIEVVSELFLAGVIGSDGVVRGELADRSNRIVADERTFSYVLGEGPPEIRVTQADIRAIQLAKAALRAGIDLLVNHAAAAGITTIDEIRLAGAFGAHIDPTHAMVLGLIPDHPVEAVSSVGNAAGAGAVRVLMSATARAEVEAVTEQVVKIETALEPTFQDLFVAALAFPHADAPTPVLSTLVDLPTPTPAGSQSGPTRRRRRRSSGAPS